MLKKLSLTFILLIVFSFSAILLGNDSTSKYFPGVLDSFWIYEDQDGNEFTRTAVEGEEIGDDLYSAFSYEPELEDWSNYSCVLQPSLYIYDGGIILAVSDDIEKALKARIKSETDVFVELIMANAPPGANFDIDIKAEVEDDFLLLPDSVDINEEWESSKTKIVLAMQANDPDMAAPEIITFIFDIVETGKVIDTETVEVPAGTYEDCLKVEYRTETTLTVLPDEIPDDQIDPPGETVTTVWFASDVGMVKYHQEREHIFLEVIPDDEGFPMPPDPKPITFELKTYEIKTENAENSDSE